MAGNILIFDIETAPDVAFGRQLMGIDDSVSDESVAEALFAKRRAAVGHDFLPLHCHQVVSISAVLVQGCGLADSNNDVSKVAVWSLGTEDDDEATIIQQFYNLIERKSPQLVSWNGGGFDLPVLHYRGMKCGVVAQDYWDQGEYERDKKFNSYLGRYHSRHLDLMDLLALYQPRANVRLDEMALLLGFPGKMGMSGDKVWQSVQAGELAEVRAYRETDVLNTYLVYLSFQQMRGQLTPDQVAMAHTQIRTWLTQQDQPHFHAFLTAWDEG